MLLNGPSSAANQLPELPSVCYSSATLEIAANLLSLPAGSSPSMTPIEGLPCRLGFADSAVAFLEGILACGVAALPRTPSKSHAAAHSSLLASQMLALMAKEQQTLTELSPCGVLSAISSLTELVTARPHDGLLNDRHRLHWLLELLSTQHLSALVVWPTSCAGNRRGVSRLLQAVCVALLQPFNNLEAAADDPVVQKVTSELQVCHTQNCGGQSLLQPAGIATSQLERASVYEDVCVDVFATTTSRLCTGPPTSCLAHWQCTGPRQANRMRGPERVRVGSAYVHHDQCADLVALLQQSAERSLRLTRVLFGDVTHQDHQDHQEQHVDGTPTCGTLFICQ
jgi:hypothetical protein